MVRQRRRGRGGRRRRADQGSGAETGEGARGGFSAWRRRGVFCTERPMPIAGAAEVSDMNRFLVVIVAAAALAVGLHPRGISMPRPSTARRSPLHRPPWEGRLRAALLVLPRWQRRRWPVRSAAEGRGIWTTLGWQAARCAVYRLSTRMPTGAPGSLGEANYAQLLAYLLQENGFSSGDAPLLPDSQSLSKCCFRRSPAARAAA